MRVSHSQPQLRINVERIGTELEGENERSAVNETESHGIREKGMEWIGNVFTPQIRGMALSALGLLLFFIVYGVLQERIMTRPYGVDDEMFRSSAFVVLCNRIIAVVGAALLLVKEGKSLSNAAPMWKSSGVGLSNTLATLCQWEALKYVSFPAQTLGKCGKTIPVLVFGSLLAAKRYGIHDYAVCIAISFGCAVFLFTGDVSAKAGSAAEDTWHGLGLLGMYLALDGFTSVFQELLFKGYNMSTYNQMLHVNLASGAVIVIVLAVEGELLPSLDFCRRHLDFLAGSLALSCAAMAGQVMLYHSIKHYGALFFATVMTTRHIFSITLSCILYMHPMSWGQLFGASIVFGALYISAVTKPSKKPQSLPVGKVVKI